MDKNTTLLTRFPPRSLFGVLQIVSMFALSIAYCSAEDVQAIAKDVQATPEVSSLDATLEQNTEPDTETLSIDNPEDPNQQCMRCHKKRKKKIAKVTFLGVHGNSPEVESCVSCHGKKGSHPKKGSTIISFAHDTKTLVSEQNGQCLECHTVAEIRSSEWTHDVHLEALSCASCHQLHPENDPIHNIKRKARIELCVDCHTQQRLDSEQSKKNQSTNIKEEQ